MRPDKVVLQLAAEPVTDEVLTALRRLQFSGYSLALDRLDDRLMPVCGILKLSITDRTDEELARADRGAARRKIAAARDGRRHARGGRRATELGFTAFQGDFFAKPDLTRRAASARAAIAASRPSRPSAAPDASFEDLEVAISSDVGL